MPININTFIFLIPPKFNMAFTRTVTSDTLTLNFSEDTIINSEHYKVFIKENPHIKNEVDILIQEFMMWARKNDGTRDKWVNSETYLSDGDGLPLYMPCQTLFVSDAEFEVQMGTNFDKFSLTQNTILPVKIVQEFAKVLDKIGFTIFIANYSHSPKMRSKAVGTYYAHFSLLKDHRGDIETYRESSGGYGSYTHYAHICITI